MTRYYYAGGERHPLVLANDRVAVDGRAAQTAGLHDAVAGLPVASKLPGGLAIVRSSEFPAGLRDKLGAAGALRPVYRSGEVQIVLLPEVRVEFDAGSRQEALRIVKGASIPSAITSDTEDRVSVRPESGDAEDALDLANYIAEHPSPTSASVRMLQVTPKRGV